MKKEKQRLRVLFIGQVQGVGFRFTAERIATLLGLVGFVRNLPDGKVELLCEGDSSILTKFLQEIKNSMSGYISDSLETRENATGEFSLFEIRSY